MGKVADFEADPLLDMNNLKELEGNLPQNEWKWLSNFVIDSYLQIVKTETNGVEVLAWENLEKGVGKKNESQLLQQKDNPFEQNVVFFPCNASINVMPFIVSKIY